jgi:hypothetical protein
LERLHALVDTVFSLTLPPFSPPTNPPSQISLTILVFGGFNLSNYAFSFLRHQPQNPPQSHHPDPQQQSQQPYADFPAQPRTPHRGYIENTTQGWQTPYATTPYTQASGFKQQHPPPQLLHSQSTPQLPSYALEGGEQAQGQGLREEAKTPGRRRGFR